MNRQVEDQVRHQSVSTDRRTASKLVRLDGVRAKRWIEFLRDLPQSGEQAHVLAEFAGQLDDALWLANWKREYVVMELELTAVPSLIAAISNHEPELASEPCLDIQEDILAALCELPRWT